MSRSWSMACAVSLSWLAGGALPRDDPDRPRLEKLFRDMAMKLEAVQKPDGYWAPSLLGAENSPAETSGTGFFVYGLAWGVNRGVLDAERYRPAIYKGWDALARAIDQEGRLGWVQQVSDRPEQVHESDTQFYGVGALLLAASEVAELSGERRTRASEPRPRKSQ